jgi:hypothetical protein
MGIMFNKLFLDHPAEAGETYGQHLAFTTKTSGELLLIGAALFIHGLLPFLFTTTASWRIARLYTTLTLRAQAIASRQNLNIPQAIHRNAPATTPIIRKAA